MTHSPDFHMSRCACSVSPHCGERWRNSSSLMAHRSFPVSSWKAFPAWGNLYRCSVHSSHFWTFPMFHSIGSKNKQRERYENDEKHPSCHSNKSPGLGLFELSLVKLSPLNSLFFPSFLQCVLCSAAFTHNSFTETTS